MEQRRLGKSGLTVSAIGLGGNTFGATVDGDEAIRTIGHAIEQGITFIDTADVYSMGRSEELVGKAIAGRRESVVVATKCGIELDSGPHAGGLSRRWIMQAGGLAAQVGDGLHRSLLCPSTGSFHAPR